MPGAAPSCNLLRVAALTIAESREWCSANASCAAFSYKDADGNSSAVRTVYFKDATQLAFMDSNFHAGGQVQSGWLTQIKRAVAPPGSWRGAPCAGTVCPAGSPPCHEACRSIAPCCSAHGPAGESLEFADGEAQLWSKRLVDGSLALLLVNLGQATATHSFALEEVGLKLNRSTAALAVRDVWERTDRAPIAKDGRVTFAAVAGHDSRFVVLTPLERSDAVPSLPSPPPRGGPAVDCLPHARQGAAAVSWNNSVLLVGGSTSPGGCLPPYTEWATVFIGTRQGGGTLAWREYTRLSSGLTHAEAVTIGDTLYVLGGFGPGPCEHSPSKGKCAHSSVWALDLARPELPAQPRAPMAYNRSNFGVSVHGGKVYTAGGYGNYGLLGSSTGPECVQSDVDVYDPATDKWSSLQPMATKRGGFSLGSVGGLLFAVAGFHCTNGPAHTESLSSVEAYDIAANKWLPVSPLPGQPNALYVLVPVDNASFLVVGGFNGTSGGDMQPEDLLRPIWKMEVDSSNPSSNSWSRVSELPNSRGFPAAALAGEQLFVIGGYDSSSKNDSALVQTLDMETRSWSNCSSARLRLEPEQSEPALSQEVAVLPGDDLAALARAHPPDTTFLLRPGTFRMQEVKPKDGQRFVGVGQSAAEVIVTGAALIPRSRVTRDAATGLHVARGIKATGTFHGPCAPGFPRCNYTQDLFLGGEPLLHVASRAALLDGPGRWYFDFNSSAVWLAADPGSDALELGTSRAFLFGGNASRVVVANLTVTKYAVTAQNGAVGGPFPGSPSDAGGGWTVEGCVLTLNHGAGAHLRAAGRSGSIVRGCRVHRNGQLGLNAGNGTLIENSDIVENNFAGFSQGWEAGGVKVAGVSGVVIRKNRIMDNNGTGLWADICSTRVSYLDNLIVNQSGPGISHEISFDATIRGNVVCGNGWGKPVWLWGAQIQVQNSERVLVYNNTVVVGPRRGNGLAIQQQNRTQCASLVAGSPFHAARHNTFDSNRVYYAVGCADPSSPACGYGQSGGVQDFAPQDPSLGLFSAEANNTWRRNTFVVAPDADERALHWQWGGSSLNFSGWQQLWGGDKLVVADTPAADLRRICSGDLGPPGVGVSGAME